MCLILDNNQWGDFLDKKDDMMPIHDWLSNKGGKLAYSNHEGFEELSKKSRKILGSYKQKGQAKLVPKKKVEEKMKEIEKSYNIKSNDLHILGLAEAENIKVICSKDKKLHIDFKEMTKGKKGRGVYQTKKHRHLLTKDLCP